MFKKKLFMKQFVNWADLVLCLTQKLLSFISTSQPIKKQRTNAFVQQIVI